MADSPQPTTSPPQEVHGFLNGRPYLVTTLGNTLLVGLGFGESSGGLLNYVPPQPALSIEVSTPGEAAQLLSLISTIKNFINHLYPNGV